MEEKIKLLERLKREIDTKPTELLIDLLDFLENQETGSVKVSDVSDTIKDEELKAFQQYSFCKERNFELEATKFLEIEKTLKNLRFKIEEKHGLRH